MAKILTPAQKRISKISKRASEIYKSKGNKLKGADKDNSKLGGNMTSQTDDVEMTDSNQCSSIDNAENIKRYGAFTYEKVTKSPIKNERGNSQILMQVVKKRSSWQDNIGKNQLSITEIIERGETEGVRTTAFDLEQNAEQGRMVAAEFSPVPKMANFVVVSGANSEISLEIQVTDILNCLKLKGIKVDLDKINEVIKAGNEKNFVISSTETRIMYALPVEEILVAGGDTDIKFYDPISGTNRYIVSQIMYGSGAKRMKTLTELRSNDGDIKVPHVLEA